MNAMQPFQKPSTPCQRHVLVIRCFSFIPHCSYPPPMTNPPSITSSIVEIIPTQRTTTTIAAPKPPIQTHRMKRVLTRPTLLLRRLHIRADNAIADRTLRLPLQRPLDIPPESDQPSIRLPEEKMMIWKVRSQDCQFLSETPTRLREVTRACSRG